MKKWHQLSAIQKINAIIWASVVVVLITIIFGKFPDEKQSAKQIKGYTTQELAERDKELKIMAAGVCIDALQDALISYQIEREINVEDILGVPRMLERRRDATGGYHITCEVDIRIGGMYMKSKNSKITYYVLERNGYYRILGVRPY